MTVTICRYKKSRYWALQDANGALICLCVYKCGAQEVQRRLQHKTVPGSQCQRTRIGEEKNDMGGNRSEHTEVSKHEETGGERTLWTPFVRTGQVVVSGFPDMPDGIVWENSRFVVIRRECGKDGRLVWLSIKNADNSARHDWREFQRLKNELVGPEVEAVELYPAESRLVDTSNQYHLWCLVGEQFPFGFGDRLVLDGVPGVSQRPFPPDARPADMATRTAVSEEAGRSSSLTGERTR